MSELTTPSGSTRRDVLKLAGAAAIGGPAPTDYLVDLHGFLGPDQ